MKRQITKTLPRSAWSNIVITESNEPLVQIPAHKKIIFTEIKEYNASYMVRKSVAEKLLRVAESLPSGIYLMIIEGYRSMESQKLSWDKACEQRTKENPNLSHQEIEDQVKLFVARPHSLANHHCGGAIDVSLCDAQGVMLDMGTPYPSEIRSDLLSYQKKFPMFPNSFFKKHINTEQSKNRKILRDVMAAQGFVWYPHEWWHYCYGDRMWAVYTKQSTCFYGPIELSK